MVRLLFLTLVLVSLVANAQEKGCPALIYSDETLLKSLPERVRNDLDTARVRLLLTQEDAVRTELFQKLDDAFLHPGTPTQLKVGQFEVTAKFEGLANGMAILRLSQAQSKTKSGIDLLRWIASQAEWIARQKEKGLLQGLKMIGEGVSGKESEKFFSTLGFKKGFFSGKLPCAIATIVSSGFGYGAGATYFAFKNDPAENGSIYDEQQIYRNSTRTGAVTGFVVGAFSFCSLKTQTELSLIVF